MSEPIAQLLFRNEEIERLVAHPDRDVRAMMAQRVCRQAKVLTLSPAEQHIVNRILRQIASDSAAMVRRALAVTLRNWPHLPHDVARTLINDADSIAAPILQYSPVLENEDLLEILRSKTAKKMMAISKRKNLSGELVKAIISYGDSQVVASAAANDGAQIGAKLGLHMLSLYHDNDLVKESFIARRDLPVLVVEKLITLVSGETARRLHEKYDVPAVQSVEIGRQVRERATTDFLANDWVSSDLALMTARLHREDRLTTTLLLRAACCGQMDFVQFGLAQRAEISRAKAGLMLHDSGPFGVQTLCSAAGLSDGEYRILRAAIAIFEDLERKNAHRSRPMFRQRMLERVLSLPLEISEDDQTYLFEKLDALGDLAA